MDEESTNSDIRTIGDKRERKKQGRENSLDVEYRLNLQTNSYDYISPIMGKITGFSVRENLAMSSNDILDLIHPDDRSAVNKGLVQAFDIGFGTLVYRFKHKDGKYRWFADHFTIIKDQNGKPLFSEGIVRDITETKKQ